MKINVQWKYVVNGKEYRSPEDMPEEIRRFCEEAKGASAGHDPQVVFDDPKEKIGFNGREYKSVDEMPADVRQLYDVVMKAVETQTAKPRGGRFSARDKSSSPYKPISPSSTSTRSLLLGSGILFLFLAIYYFLFLC